jgi:acetylornithine deacetylase/succinyl-diaminopimelate desuccinylase-like protein
MEVGRMDDATSDRVAAAVDADEVADLAVALGEIESPAGSELAVAEHVHAWLRQQGFRPKYVGLVPGRPAVLARLEGEGSGPSLAFNAHMDTAIGKDDWLVYREPDVPKYVSGWREGDQLFGNGVVNDKGPLAAFLVAAATIKRLGVRLAGTVVLTAVPGEIGLEPVDELTGPEHLGKDLGTRFVVAHGGVSDAALVAEATGNTIGWVEAGKAFFKITVLGGEPLYTPFTPLETDMVAHPNAIVRSAVVIQALTAWSATYGEQVYHCEGGTVQGRANIGAVRSGRPDKITKSTQVSFLYLDVRLLPGAPPLDVQRDLVRTLAATGVPCEVELTTYRRGWEAEGVEEIVGAVRRAHRAELGAEPERPPTPVTSMWRDTTPYIEAGIPAVMYGPSASSGGGNHTVSVEQLALAARVYARSAVAYCGVS